MDRGTLNTAIGYNRDLLVQPFGFGRPIADRIDHAKESNTVSTVERDSTPTVVKSVCPLDCPDTCSMLVTVKDGVAVELRGDPDHPFTRGFLCQKMARYLERVYSPDRLLHPMKRVGQKGEGRFERITWDEALDTIARAVRDDRPIGRRPRGDPAI